MGSLLGSVLSPGNAGEQAGMFSQMLLGNAPIWSRGLEKPKPSCYSLPSFFFFPFFVSWGCWNLISASPQSFSCLLTAVMEQGPEDGSKRPIPAGLTGNFFKNKSEVITNPRLSDPTSRLFLGRALHRGFCFGFLSQGRN